jgi:hypothetical protein
MDINPFVLGFFVVGGLGMIGFFIFLKVKMKVLSRAGHSGSVIGATTAQSSGFFLKLAGPMFTIIGCGVLVIGILNVIKGSESASWPTARGEVLVSEVQSRMESTESSRGTGSRRKRTTSTTRVYWAELKYSYSVDGASFEGERVDYGMESRSSKRTRADEIVALYPVGEEALVYYDPTDPSEAVLEPGVAGSAIAFPLIGAVLALIGLVMLFFLFRAKTEEE